MVGRLDPQRASTFLKRIKTSTPSQPQLYMALSKVKQETYGRDKERFEEGKWEKCLFFIVYSLIYLFPLLIHSLFDSLYFNIVGRKYTFPPFGAVLAPLFLHLSPSQPFKFIL